MATISLTKEQYVEIITAFMEGVRVQKNRPVATALQVEANTGLRIGDVLNLKRGDIVMDGDKYRFFNFREQKTSKVRSFVVPVPVYEMLEQYCVDYGIKPGERMFNCTVRNVQKLLKKVADFFDYDHISTHSFRKFFGTKAYIESGYDIELVRRLYQHSSAAVTSRYIGITDARTEGVLNACVDLI